MAEGEGSEVTQHMVVVKEGQVKSENEREFELQIKNKDNQQNPNQNPNQNHNPDSPYGPNPFAALGPNSNPNMAMEWSYRQEQPQDISNYKKQSETSWHEKAEEIEARTRELQLKEAELRHRQTQMNNYPSKNFPSFFPLLYHDIEAELPSAGQDLAKSSFFIWQCTTIAYIVNLVTTIVMLISGVPGYGSITGIVLAAIYLVLFPGLAFMSWHMSLYKALKFDSSFWYVSYFVSFGIQILIYGFLAVGLINGGGGGLLGMLEMLGHGKIVAGIFSGLCTASMIFSLLMGIGLVKRVNDHFRSSGHSMERAGAEAGRNIASNETVRKSAKEAVFNNV